MDVRGKLVELLEPHMSDLSCEYESGSCELTSCRTCNARNVADHLITNGVTVQECGSWKYYHKQNKAVCTNCSFERDLDANFGKAIACPNCGAYMRQPPKGE